MNNKIWLTSILALCMATPAMALVINNDIEDQIANASGLLQGKSCDESTLGVTEGTANIEAIWTANTYSISYKCNANDQNEINFLRRNTMVNCSEDPTNDECITPRHAVYDKNFTFPFAQFKCYTAGYQQTGWLCKNAGDANATATRYDLAQTLTPWDLTYNLACVAEMTPNTITLDWYDRGVKQTVSSSVAECTYDDASTLNLPSNPAARAGYTFSGWKVFNICETLSTQNTCNLNASCFWNGDVNNGTCMNINIAEQTCSNVGDDRTACNAIGYCFYDRFAKTCSAASYSYCLNFNSTECAAHPECHWLIEQPDFGNNQTIHIGNDEYPMCVGEEIWERIQATPLI